jgi:hypothetical protein
MAYGKAILSNILGNQAISFKLTVPQWCHHIIDNVMTCFKVMDWVVMFLAVFSVRPALAHSSLVPIAINTGTTCPSTIDPNWTVEWLKAVQRMGFLITVLFLFSSVAFAQLTLNEEFCSSEEVAGTGELTCFALTDGTPNVYANDVQSSVTRASSEEFIYSFSGGQLATITSVQFVTGDSWNDGYRTREVRVQTATDVNFNTAIVIANHW